jgi:hypothetical protein
MSRLTAVLLFVLLGACSQAQHVAAPSVPEPSEAEPIAETTALPEEEIAVPPLPAEKPETPKIAIDDLIGLQDDMVTALIGQPALREDRAPAVVWVYEASACRFGLLLYPDLESNHSTVLSYETEQPDACAADMVKP